MQLVYFDMGDSQALPPWTKTGSSQSLQNNHMTHLLKSKSQQLKCLLSKQISESISGSGSCEEEGSFGSDDSSGEEESMVAFPSANSSVTYSDLDPTKDILSDTFIVSSFKKVSAVHVVTNCYYDFRRKLVFLSRVLKTAKNSDVL